MSKIHSLPSQILKTLNLFQDQLKSKISSKYKVPILSPKSSKSGIQVRLWARFILEKSSSPSVDLWNLGNKLSFQNTMAGQAGERHFHSKSRNWEENWGYTSQTSPRPSSANSIRFQGPRIVLCGSTLCLLGQLAAGPHPSGYCRRAWLPWRWGWRDGGRHWKEKMENIWK